MKTLSFLMLMFGLASCGSDDIVRIDQGYIEGSALKSRSGREFKAFQGIPYAQPPVGHLRFKNPVPAGSWDGVLNATTEPQACIQFSDDVIGSEDCLYLNVYTPKIPKNGKDKLLPVMFWIHGGGNTDGSGGISFYGPRYLLDKDVVVVTVNYRLGVLGFLSTGDANLPGNYGLKDQVLALKWVKNNICKFGGDPNSVTIFGESSGAACVGLHLLSQMSKELFHKAIMESGTALEPWAVSPQVLTKQNALGVANVTGCPAESKDLVDCLKGLPASELVNMNNKSTSWRTDIYLYPVVENCDDTQESFLCEYPALNFTQVSKVPVLLGMNSGEGGSIAAAMYNATNLVDLELKNNFDQYVAWQLRYIYSAKSSDIPKIGEKIFDRYYPDGSLEDPLKTVKMFTDGEYFHGIVKMAVKISPPVYFYVYDHLNEKTFNSFYGSYPYPKKLGVTHADELLSLFYIELFGGLNGDDVEVSKTMVNLWTRFAISKDITIDGTNGGAKWPVFDSDTMKYLLINSSSPLILEKQFEADFAFWEDLPLLSGLKET